MFCDRFSMYLYENYLKIQLYHDALAERIGYSITVDIMLTLEGARVQDRLDSRHEIRGLPEADLSKLEQDLQDAEQDHLYIKAFGDPVITGAERELFRSFLGLLKHYDDGNRIMRFTMQHADSSRFLHATVSGLTQEFDLDPAKLPEVSRTG